MLSLLPLLPASRAAAPRAARPPVAARATLHGCSRLAKPRATRVRAQVRARPRAAWLWRSSHAPAQPWAPRAAAQATGDLPAPLKKIVTAFQMVPDPMQRYKQLLFYASKLKALPAEHHTPENKVPGCVSQVSASALPRASRPARPAIARPRAPCTACADVWLRLCRAGVGAADAAGRQGVFPGGLGLAADQGAPPRAALLARAALTCRARLQGLAALLVEGLSGCTPDEVLRVTPEFIEMLGLKQSLTPSRNNGCVGATLRPVGLFSRVLTPPARS